MGITPLDRALAALRRYADPLNWHRPSLMSFALTPVAQDKGKRARAALKELGKDGGQLTFAEEATQ